MRDKQDCSLASMLQAARAAKGRPLTPEERARYVEMASEIERLEIELAEAQAKDQEAVLQVIDRLERFPLVGTFRNDHAKTFATYQTTIPDCRSSWRMIRILTVFSASRLFPSGLE